MAASHRTVLTERDRAVRRVLIWVLGMNLIVAGIKITVAILTQSVAALAETVHGLLDASANVIGIYGLTVAYQPPDSEHPYGHRRFESLAALGIGVLVTLGLVQILEGLWNALTGQREVPTAEPLAIGLLVLTAVLNLIVGRYEAARGRELSSALLTADAGHTLSDGLGVLVVLASLAGTHYHIPYADVVGGVIVALLIGRTALTIIRTNVANLADAAQLDPDKVKATVLSVQGVCGTHQIRSRGLDGHVYVDLHVQLRADLPLRDAHALTHRVKDVIMRTYPDVADVVIHTEPDSRP